MTSCFVSQFKIDGVPILPPVMTEEVIAEAAEFRRRALEVEKRLRKARAGMATSLDISEGPPPTAVVKIELSPEQTIRRNSFTLEAPSPGLAASLPHFGSPVHETIKMEAPTELDCSDESPRPRLIRSNSYTLESPSPLLMKHLENESLNIKMSSSMSEIRREEPRLASAKSHVKRLEFEGNLNQQLPVRKELSKIARSKPKWVSTKKVAIKSMTPPAKKMKSPYESVSAIKLKTIGKRSGKTTREAAPMDAFINPKSPLIPSTVLSIQQIRAQHQQRMATLMKRQEAEQLALQERFRRQQEELMTMLPASDPLSVASAVLDEIHTSTPLPTSPNETMIEDDKDLPVLQSFRKLNISTKQFSHNNQSQSSIDNLSSSQTLLISSNASRASSDFEDSNELFKTCNNNTNDINGNVQVEGIRIYAETIRKNLQDCDLRGLTEFERVCKSDDFTRHQAATVINAYVRGYLTRRLFQTFRVQKIIQVIRDTLLFILDLHHESTARQQMRSPADLQLKRTLLHQLTSACYQLHETFFGISISKRMEIIRVDRENLRRKLENRPWTAGSERSIWSESSSKSQNNYQKLQKCSLYSVNIEATPTENNNGLEEDNESPTPSPVPEVQPRSFRPSSVTAIATESPLNLSDNLTKAVVSRLVNQVKYAATNQQVRPKTTGAANRTNNISWEQRHF